MQEKLNIALVQTELIWEDAEGNRKSIARQIEALSDKVDLIVLPEMFTTGFSMQPANLAETMEGESILWLQALSKKYKAAICGSLIIKEGGFFYNRLVFVEPSGRKHSYDKRHTFTLAGEDKTYKAGTKRLIVDYKGWKICPMICYDLRFPVWARNTVNYDLLIYVANWPKPRIMAWETLLKARAIENMSYCLGVNRIGLDNNGFEYTGNSCAFDSLGTLISAIPQNIGHTEIIELSKEHLSGSRNKFQFLEDRDDFELFS